MAIITVHLTFDLLAAISSFAMTVFVYVWRLKARTENTVGASGAGYGLALALGAAAGGFGLGSLNLALSGIDALGRSMLGALAGGIAGVEIFKWVRGISGSTGLIFVFGFSTAVAVGRIGCFLSGIGDQTYGIATALPWGWDFGDGVGRHPVQLYEAAAMALFLVWAVAALARRAPLLMESGFYVMVGFYALQRFVWEFLKPYAAILGSLNLFHFVCLGLLAYAVAMTVRKSHVRP